jgi:hypothetical protein
MMTDFLQQIMAFPTVFYTALLAVVLIYWVFVILGALDIDMFHFDGAGEGAMDGAAEGAVDAAGHAHEGLVEGLSLASFLGLRKAPFTVIVSLMILAAWTFCILGMRYLAPALGGLLPEVVASGLVAALALVVAMPLTGLTARPLAPLFETHKAGRRDDLVGRTCRIETGTVDARFGLATVEEDGGWMKVHVVCEPPNALQRGDEALIIAYDPEREVFRVEPLGAERTT